MGEGGGPSENLLIVNGQWLMSSPLGNPLEFFLNRPPQIFLKNCFSTAQQEMYRFIGNMLFYRTISREGKQPDSSNREKGETGISPAPTVQLPGL